MAQVRRAVALDPVNVWQLVNMGDIYYTERQYDDAIPFFRKALDMDPNTVDAHLGLGWVYEEKKMYPDALAELQKEVDLSNRHEVPLASLGYILGKSGRKTAATKILNELKRRAGNRYVAPCLIALVQIGPNERDQAIASLEKGYTERDQWLLYLKVDPHMDDLRSDPRFQRLVEQVGIP